MSDNDVKTLRIAEIREEVKDFKTFSFEDGHNINYKAGQYLTLIKYQGDKEVRRSYSITSSPVLNEPLTVGVKRVENGFFSRQLVDHAKPADEIITTGNGGLFILPEDIHSYNQLFFFAAGSGITPVYSLIKTALHVHSHLSLVLIYSNPSVDKAAFLKPLQQLQKTFPQRFHLELLFSNLADLVKARLHRDLIVKFLYQFSAGDVNMKLFYICGPESYMRLCTYTLQEHGIDANNIKKENFVIHTAPKIDRSPPDKKNHNVHIRINDRQYDITVQYPDSILRAARKQDITLPYSCETGRCGNCVAKCIKGTVWHSYNEVLTDRELEKGLVLTCVGHPVGGDVELEIK